MSFRLVFVGLLILFGSFIIYGEAANRFLRGDTDDIGMCKCGAFFENENSTLDFLKQINLMNSSCNYAGRQQCLQMCTNFATFINDNSPELLCKYHPNAHFVKILLFTKMCSDDWSFANITSKELCCDDGDFVDCATIELYNKRAREKYLTTLLIILFVIVSLLTVSTYCRYFRRRPNNTYVVGAACLL